MKIFSAIFFAIFLAAPVLFAADPGGFENRCGWVDNPTPANWELWDKDGTWSISVQGGREADGDLPEFPENKAYWKITNVHYGYGCGCLMVKVDKKEKTILEIKGGKALPLSKCRADKTLDHKYH